MHRGIIRFGPVRRGHLIAHDQPIGPGTDGDGIAVFHVSGQQHLGQRILHGALDHPLEGPRPKDRIIAFVSQPLARGVIQIKDLVLGAQIAENATLEEWKERPSQFEVPRSELVAKVRDILKAQS